MKGRYLIFGAAAVYVAVVGCVVWPQAPAVPRPGESEASESSAYEPHAPRVKLEGLPLRGLAMQLQDPREMERYKHAIDQIAGVGADTIELVVAARQENGSSSRIFLDLRRTPTGDQIAELVDRAKKNKLRVVLMPIVLLDAPEGNDWRGTLHPEVGGQKAWEEWFESYREMMKFYADLAQRTKVDVLSVGSELVKTEDHASDWARTIRVVRASYHGLLTYSSNWDHYENIPFWDQLDIIGMNSYWLMGKDRNVTVDEIVARWKEIQKDLMAFSNKKGKPILLMEAGWCSMANAAHEPWDYTKSAEKLDLELQRKLYEAFFESWYGNPNMAGFMMWEWEPYGGGMENRSYTPEGKPAEKVLREWLAKGPWEVK